MHNKTMYWLTGILAAVITIMAIYFTLQHYAQYQGGGQHNLTDHRQAVPFPNGDKLETAAATRYLEEQDKIMSDMMNAMETAVGSGSASIDFLTGMIPHHESAIAMADSYMKNGAKDTALIKIARQIKDAQTQETAQMEQMLQRLRASGAKDEAKAKAYGQNYKSMLQKHHKMHAASADTVDEAFAEGMILHHQMAADMAKEILKYTDDAHVRTLADTIVSSQEEEVRRMQEIQNNLEAQKANPHAHAGR